MAEIDKWSIDKLDSLNWMTWKFQIKHNIILLAKDLWGLVDGTEVLQDDAVSATAGGFQQEVSEGVLYYGNVSKFVATLPHHLV